MSSGAAAALRFGLKVRFTVPPLASAWITSISGPTVAGVAGATPKLVKLREPQENVSPTTLSGAKGPAHKSAAFIPLETIISAINKNMTGFIISTIGLSFHQPSQRLSDNV